MSKSSSEPKFVNGAASSIEKFERQVEISTKNIQRNDTKLIKENDDYDDNGSSLGGQNINNEEIIFFSPQFKDSNNLTDNLDVIKSLHEGTKLT